MHGDDKMRLLYEASYRGCVSTLNSLIQQHPLILHKISQTAFTETPLHVSALVGHLEFTKALLTYKPKLALELDSSRSTALHVASAEGHLDIVKELLLAYDQACLVLDEEGRIPLHYAVMRGRIEIVKELTRAAPESLKILHKGKSVLHLCVTYNHLETLKALVELEVDTSELLNLRDLDGNKTVFLLAIMSKQVETVKYLLSIPQIREEASWEEMESILKPSAEDLKSQEIQLLLMNADIKSKETNEIETQSNNLNPNPRTPMRPPMKMGWKKALKIIFLGNWLKHDGNWLEEARGNLSLVSTVISTITFQAAINPPGGLIQPGISSQSNFPLWCIKQEDYVVCPGEAVLAFQFPRQFLNYLTYNTLCFIASLSVTLLLVSGVFPLKHKAVMWILSIGMCTTLTYLALTYLNGVLMVTPPHLWPQVSTMIRVSVFAWVGLFELVNLSIALRFVIWIVKKCIKKMRNQS